MNKLLILILSLLLTTPSFAYLTAGKIAVTKTSSSSGVSSTSQDSDITDTVGASVSVGVPLTVTTISGTSSSFGSSSVTGVFSAGGVSTLSGGASVGSINGVIKGTSGTLSAATADTDYTTPTGSEVFTNKTYDTAGSGNVFKINGQAISAVSGNTTKVGTVTGALTSGHGITADASGNLQDSGGVPLTGTKTGNTTVFATATGSFTTNNCLKIDASGNVVDNGSTCSGGSGAVYPAAAGIVTTNSSAWTTSIPATTLTTSGTNVGVGSTNPGQALDVQGTVRASFLSGTIQTAAQPNITSVGTLSALTVSNSTGIDKRTSGVLGTAVSGTDYAPATSGSSVLSGNGSGGFSNVTIGSGLSFAAGTLSSSGGFVPTNMQVFTTSGTWTKPAGISNVYVKVIGAGGNGGTAGNTASGGGAGAGGYAEGVIAVTGNVTVTIGATNSFAGTTTIQATAGTAGTNGTASVGGLAGPGGVGSNGTLNLTGATGSDAFSDAKNDDGPSGGSSAFGPGGGVTKKTSGNCANGYNGQKYGGGGGGAAGGTGGSCTGGTGDPGAVIVYY